MVGKEMEGDNLQRRHKAREAREHGKRASEVDATTGGSKHRHHRRHGGEHEHVERLETLHHGKQDVFKGKTPAAKPRSRPEGPPEERL